VENVAYYIGTRDFAREQRALVEAILAEVGSTGAWANKNSPAVVDLLAPQIGIAREALSLSLSRNQFGVKPVGPELLVSQQRIADAFLSLKLIPKPLRVADARWERGPVPPTTARR
jgi:sulfonate transport system substrate-binding protein